MRVALDTNVLAYAEGINGAQRQTDAVSLLENLEGATVLLPVQILGELYQLLLKKGKRTPPQARMAVLAWRDAYSSIETSEDVLVMAAELAATRRFSIWDGVVLAAAVKADCRLLLSEDLQAGFTWSGVTVTNPFSASPHPLFTDLIRRKG